MSDEPSVEDQPSGYLQWIILLALGLADEAGLTEDQLRQEVEREHEGYDAARVDAALERLEQEGAIERDGPHIRATRVAAYVLSLSDSGRR